MSSVNRVMCDGCGKVFDHKDEDFEHIHIEAGMEQVKVRLEISLRGENVLVEGYDPLDFCTVQCFKQWIDEKVKYGQSHSWESWPGLYGMYLGGGSWCTAEIPSISIGIEDRTVRGVLNRIGDVVNSAADIKGIQLIVEQTEDQIEKGEFILRVVGASEKREEFYNWCKRREQDV